MVLAESSIELVPKELVHHPAIVKSARRKKKDPATLVLDQTYHHSAILQLGTRGIGRGRPDISHLCLLLALGSPLNRSGSLKCYVHTIDDNIIRIDPKARLPRNTDRFTSLVEQLYQERVVPQTGHPLMTINPGTLRNILDEISGIVVALTTTGVSKPLSEAAAELVEYDDPVLLVGGFPTGHFSQKTLSLADKSYKIHSEGLEAWTVVARVIYDFEKALG